MIPKKSSWLLGIFVIALDQVSKFLISKFFPDIIFKNPGLPFGINLPGFFNFAVIVIALIIFIFATYIFFDSYPIGAALIIAGAVSNLFDRMAMDAVRDFLNIGIATINLADIAIYLGVGVLLWSIKFQH